MADEALLNQRLVEFVKIAGRYSGAEDWIGYALWETVEGIRKRPLPFFDPLSEKEMCTLRSLRDEFKVWLYWEEQWSMVPIEDWRAHASSRTAKDVIDEMHAISGGVR